MVQILGKPVYEEDDEEFDEDYQESDESSLLNSTKALLNSLMNNPSLYVSFKHSTLFQYYAHLHILIIDGCTNTISISKVQPCLLESWNGTDK